MNTTLNLGISYPLNLVPLIFTYPNCSRRLRNDPLPLSELILGSPLQATGLANGPFATYHRDTASHMPDSTCVGISRANTSTSVPTVAAVTAPPTAASAKADSSPNTETAGKHRAVRAQTPLKIGVLKSYLKDYTAPDKEFLLQGLEFGFHIPFEGCLPPLTVRNHRSVLSSPDVVSQMIDKECKLGRVAGPFSTPPLSNFHSSPLGLVAKKEPGSFRIIHDLSFPIGRSVNSGIPPECSKVRYQTLDDALKIIVGLGGECLIAKADIESAYRIIPIHPDSVHLLGFTWEDHFYYDRCLPFGLSISCRIFEAFSSAIHWILSFHFNVPSLTHIIDDFMFFGPPKSLVCSTSLLAFLTLSADAGIPIKAPKTCPPSSNAILYGIEVDTSAMEARLPQEKLDRSRSAVTAMLGRNKTTLKELQSLLGLLNFVCLVIFPGRCFLRRLFALTKKASQPTHFIRLTQEAKLDLEAWLVFLDEFNGITLLRQRRWLSSAKLHLFTDAATSVGYGAVLGNDWVAGLWPGTWKSFHITIMELYPIVLAVELWSARLSNCSIIFHCDNMAVCHIINSHSSKDPIVMILVRRLVVASMKFNILFHGLHIPGLLNPLADALSRQDLDKARSLAPSLAAAATPVPPSLLPEGILERKFWRQLWPLRPDKSMAGH